MQEHSPPRENVREKLADPFPRSSELEFRRLLEKLPAGAYTCDPDGLITYYNQHAVDLWGRAPKLNDPVDRYCGSFKLFSTDGASISHDRCWMALALNTDQEYNGREIVVERPDGERLTALAHANPIRDESGGLLGAVNVLVDISERKRAEEALLEMREYERRRIARDLHDSVLQDLAYAAQTLSYATLCAEGTGIEVELHDVNDMIRRAAVELRGIVYDLRLGDSSDQSFPELLESLVARSRGMARDYEIRLEVDDSFPEKPLGEAGTELLRIILEALTNARRHSAPDRVLVSLKVEEGYMLAEVVDDGCGMPPGVKLGVGMRSMRERAATVGGELEIESQPEQGTTVRFRAPAEQLLRRV